MVNVTKNFICLLLALLLVACGEKNNDTEQVDDVDSSNNPSLPTYIVGTDPSFAPFEFRDEQGLVTGFDFDLLTAIGEAAGFNVNFIPTPWDGIFDKLGSDFDILASGIAITDERKKLADFSDPYIETYGVVMLNNYNNSIKEFDDLKTANIAVQKGEYNVRFLKALDENIEDKIEFHSTGYLAFAAVATGKSDATVGNVHGFRYLANNHGVRIKELTIPDSGTNNMGYAVAKGNSELLNEINKGLRIIKQNGTYDEIMEKWFGSAQ